MRTVLPRLLPCAYVPRHAAPREPLSLDTRAALATGLALAVLPLGAAPALADGAPAGQDGATSSSTTARNAPASDEAPGDASDEQSRRASTSLTLSAPSSARTSAVRVGVRLLADGKGVRNGYVRIEKATRSGWSFAGRLLTDDAGAGAGTFRVAGSTRLRAAYTGSEVRSPAVTAARTVRAKSTTRAAAGRSSVEGGSVDGSAVLDEAAKHVGKPYRYGAVGPDAFDCSGFTRYVYGRLGTSLPHSSRGQEQATTPVSKADAQPGDLVFIQGTGGHVGIYAGGGRMYDAPRSGATVTLRSIWTDDYTVGRVR